MKKRFKEANSGAWIFVSYSHRDLEKVHPLRIELERHKHALLLFSLKCFKDVRCACPNSFRGDIQARK